MRRILFYLLKPSKFILIILAGILLVFGFETYSRWVDFLYTDKVMGIIGRVFDAFWPK